LLVAAAAGGWALADLPRPTVVRVTIAIAGCLLIALNLRFMYTASWYHAGFCRRCAFDAEARRRTCALCAAAHRADWLEERLPDARVGFFALNDATPAGYTGYSRGGNWHDLAAFGALAQRRARTTCCDRARVEAYARARPRAGASRGNRDRGVPRPRYKPMWQFDNYRVAVVVPPATLRPTRCRRGADPAASTRKICSTMSDGRRRSSGSASVTPSHVTRRRQRRARVVAQALPQAVAHDRRQLARSISTKPPDAQGARAHPDGSTTGAARESRPATNGRAARASRPRASASATALDRAATARQVDREHAAGCQHGAHVAQRPARVGKVLEHVVERDDVVASVARQRCGEDSRSTPDARARRRAHRSCIGSMPAAA
jgi:hypothetical protein